MIQLLAAIAVFLATVVGMAGLLVLAARYLVTYGTVQLKINDEEPMPVDGGQNLLMALYGKKLFIPSACGGRGTCGYCKVKVPPGDDAAGPVLPTELPFLTRKEIRAGVRLSCQIKVKKDIRIFIPEEFLKVQEFHARVASTRPVTPDIKEIRFAIEEPKEIEFQAGQFVQVRVPAPDEPNGFVFRAYSISSAVYEKGEVELNVRLVPKGKGTTFLFGLTEGDPVIFTGPYGEFRLSEDPESELILIGGGVGMAPMKCLILSLLATWPDRKCTFFFGCRGTRDIFYYDLYRDLAKKHPNFTVLYALSDLQEGEEWDGPTGFIHLWVEKEYEPEKKRQVFLCGPPPMINAAMKVLQEKGIRIAEEAFYDKFE